MVVTRFEATDEFEFPFAFVAVTVKEYCVLDGSPVTDIGDPAPATTKPAGELYVVYPVIALPPVAGAVNATSIRPLLYARPEPRFVAVPIVGLFGTVVAVIEFEALAVAGLLPVVVFATAVKV